jgi:hypothetical protein
VCGARSDELITVTDADIVTEDISGQDRVSSRNEREKQRPAAKTTFHS